MHIVHYCPSRYPIPPVDYGGTERIVYWLARAQHQRGQRVTVIAHPDSRIQLAHPGIELIPWRDGAALSALVPAAADVVHLHHLPPDFQGLDQPYLLTEHGNRGVEALKQKNAVFVSRSHAELYGRSAYVCNAIPVEEYRYSEEKDDYMFFMTRMEYPPKNARAALDLAVDLGVELRITGKRSPWVRPKLWGAWCRRPLTAMRCVRRLDYLEGELKQALLSRAAVFFHAVNWHEPAGLAVLEALACGTPVLATPNGALPEFVRHGENGLLVSSYQEALEGARRLLGLSASERRVWARRCRDGLPRLGDMVDGYSRMYERVIAGESLTRPDDPSRLATRAVVRIDKPTWS